MSTEKVDTGQNNMVKKVCNLGDECLALRRFNYENLDRAVWKAHQASWFMTSIFVPVILAGLGYLLKELDNISTVGVVMGAVVVVGTTWFWFTFTRILAKYNGRRLNQLMKLEKVFDEYYPEVLVRKERQFVQYRKFAGTSSKLRFKYAALGFAIFLSLISAGAVIAKIVLLCKSNGSNVLT